MPGPLVLLLLLGLAAADVAFPATAASAAQSVYFGSYSSIEIEHARVTDLLKEPLLSYQHSLPPTELRRGLVYTGSNHRLRRAMREILDVHSKQQVVKIVLLGEAATTCTPGVSQTWAVLFTEWGKSALPRASVKTVCKPAPELIRAGCLDRWVDPDTDVVVVEALLGMGLKNSILDTPQLKAYEQLVRRALALPGRPAVVMLQTFGSPQASKLPDQQADRMGPPTNGFWTTMEDAMGPLALYYDVQWLSLRSSTYRLSHFGKDPKWAMDKIVDPVTGVPRELGHRCLADLAVWLFQQTALELVMRPLDARDQLQLQEPVPRPMQKNLEEPAACPAAKRRLLGH